jgi:23S rRNA pseudouridine1911/1915/1917 synthase
MSTGHKQQEVPDALSGQRLDQVLAELFPDYSRSRLQAWLKSGWITLDGRDAKAKEKVFGGELIEFAEQTALDSLPTERWDAQPIPLDVVYEDDSLLVINKPKGLVVHPGAGNLDGTLVNALLNHAPVLEQLPRAGIIHRLDKDTTGLLVIAKTFKAHTSLVEQLQAREFEREYRALINGVVTGGGTVNEPIGRHPTQRTRQAVVHNGKPAVTHYRLLKRYRGHCLLRVNLETGRTHQIRVHMAHLRHPLVGDATYGGRLRIPKGCIDELAAALRGFKRQALHAARLGFIHPETGEHIAWEVAVPKDMQDLIDVLEKDATSMDREDDY